MTTLSIVNSGAVGADGKKARKAMVEMIVDALIIGGIAVAAVMGNDVPTTTEIWVMLKAFGAAFFLQLAIERGIKRG